MNSNYFALQAVATQRSTEIAKAARQSRRTSEASKMRAARRFTDTRSWVADRLHNLASRVQPASPHRAH